MACRNENQLNWNPFTPKSTQPTEELPTQPAAGGLNRLLKTDDPRKFIIPIIIGASVIVLAGGALAAYKLTHRHQSSGTVNPASTQNSNQTNGSTQNNPAATSNNAASNSSGTTSGSGSSGSSGSGGSGPVSTSGPIGFVGCSNSRDTVLGYHNDGGTKMWVPPATAYGGGTVFRWTQDTKYWSGFDSLNADHPGTKVIWWSLCTYTVSKGETDSANYTAALSIIATLKQKIPGVIIYASALNTYVAPHICGVTGADGPSRMQSLVDRLVSEGRVNRGPVVGSLLSIYPTNVSAGATADNNQTQSDGCHPNDAGKAHLGQSLVNFFGK